MLQPEQSCAPPARPCREKPASLRWVAATDDQGRAYYYNEATHSSQWEKPAVLAWRQVCGLCAALRSCFRAGVVAAGWLGGRVGRASQQTADCALGALHAFSGQCRPALPLLQMEEQAGAKTEL